MSPKPSLPERAVIAVLFALVFLYVVLPLAATVVHSVTISGGSAYLEFLSLSGPGYRSLRNSVLFSVLTVLLAGAVGIPLGILLTRAGPLRTLFLVLLGLPLLLPPIVGIVAIESLVGPLGLLPRLASKLFGTDPLDVALRGLPAALLVHVYSFQVYFVLLVHAGARSLDPRLAEAARTLGATRQVAFRKAVWPALLPSIQAAAILVFMSSMASFSAPYFFAPGVELLTVRIYQAEEAGHHDLALARTVVLAAASLLIVAAFSRKVETAGEGSKGGGATEGPGGGRANPWAILALSLGSALALAPHAVLLALSFTGVEGWSGSAYATLAADVTSRLTGQPGTGVATPFLSSTWMSLVSLAGDIAVGVTAAYLIARRRFAGSGLLTFLLTIPWAIPGTSLALALLTATKRSDPVIPGHALAGTVWLLPLAYFVRNLPLMTRAGLASMVSVPSDVEAAGRTLGATFGRNLRKVVLPLAAPGLMAGAVMTLLLCLGEFVVSVMLFVPDNVPISVAILQARRARDFQSAAMYGGVLLMVSVGLLAVRAGVRRKGRVVPVPVATG